MFIWKTFYLSFNSERQFYLVIFDPQLFFFFFQHCECIISLCKTLLIVLWEFPCV